MEIKILKKCFTGQRGNMHAGETHDLDQRIAEKLIARGFAEPVKKAGRPKKKLFDRAADAGEIETPEDE